MQWIHNPVTHQDFAFSVDDALSENALKDINLYVSQTKPERAGIKQNPSADDDPNVIRRSDIIWISSEKTSTKRLYENVCSLGEFVNNQFFRYNIYLQETLQYSIYRGDEEGHYDWHIDAMHKGDHHLVRKISFSIGLNDPSEYEGGNLEFFPTNDSRRIKLRKNQGVFFNSLIAHRVTPVTKGTRISLVGWIHGPEFI